MKKEDIEKFFPDNRWKEARTSFANFYSDNQIRLDESCNALRQLLSLLLSNEFSPVPKILGRVKEKEECIKKFEVRYLKDFEEKDGGFLIENEISDLVGLRVVCIYESDIQKAADIISNHLNVFDITDKTSALEIHDNQFGYKGLHLDTKLDPERAKLPEYSRFSDLQFEIQIRSIVQDAWSEVDHRLKYKKRIPSNLKRRINRLAALFELADQEFEAIRDNTRNLEEEGQKDTTDDKLDHLLSPFNFVPIMSKYYDVFDFEAHKVDGFIDELLDQDNDITVRQLENIVKKHHSKVKKFKDYLATPPLDHKMNAFTQLRHMLYLENKVLYDGLMRPGPKRNFDRWLEHGTVHPSEVDVKKAKQKG